MSVKIATEKTVFTVTRLQQAASANIVSIFHKTNLSCCRKYEKLALVVMVTTEGLSMEGITTSGIIVRREKFPSAKLRRGFRGGNISQLHFYQSIQQMGTSLSQAGNLLCIAD